jgi:hypothetical protein
VDDLQHRGDAPLSRRSSCALLVAIFIGFVNGIFVTRLAIPSFLVTLGMLLVVRGSALWLTSGFPQRTWDAGEQWLAPVLGGRFLHRRAPDLHEPDLVHPDRGGLPLPADANALRQLDPGHGRQPQCRARTGACRSSASR